jgi:Uncharacterized protein conserved in bacteria
MSPQALHPVARNPLRTRRDLQQAFDQICGPLRPYYSPGRARIDLMDAGAAYPSATAGFETFSRVLWGLVPLMSGGGSSEQWAEQLDGIRNGTNPEHEEYWGDLHDYDQRMVEMAALGVALCLIPGHIWEPLSDEEKSRFAAWLEQINDKKIWGCNWLFFLVLANLGLKNVGMPYNQARINECLDELDSYYLSDGWYADGLGGHCDYYGPFAIHYYGLFYAAQMETEDPVRAQLYKDRAVRFAEDFIHWFAEDGSALPYGRSLSYRFAQSAFWSAAVYAGIEPFPMGVMKGLLLRNLRWWFRQRIFRPDGTLSVGYSYPNLVMAENYNAPGSPYWAMKSFLPLALDENHPFWTAEELPLPPLDTKSVQKPPHLVLCRNEDGSHVAAFNSGHLSSNEHTHTSAKYEKFVYSNAFGFSVPRAEWGLAQGAFDSMLALSEGDNLYRVKRKCETTSVDGAALYAEWKPWHDVTVHTWLIPGMPWHVRIHCIDAGRPLDAAEGGFAVGLECSATGRPYAQERSESEAEMMLKTDGGASGIRILHGTGAPQLIYPNSNTNIVHTRTAIPTVKASLPAGRSWIVTAIYGESSSDRYPDSRQLAPYAEATENHIVVYRHDGEELYRVEKD